MGRLSHVADMPALSVGEIKCADTVWVQLYDIAAVTGHVGHGGGTFG